jgi:hypothetical protein
MYFVEFCVLYNCVDMLTEKANIEDILGSIPMLPLVSE